MEWYTTLGTTSLVTRRPPTWPLRSQSVRILPTAHRGAALLSLLKALAHLWPFAMVFQWKKWRDDTIWPPSLWPVGQNKRRPILTTAFPKKPQNPGKTEWPEVMLGCSSWLARAISYADSDPPRESVVCTSTTLITYPSSRRLDQRRVTFWKAHTAIIPTEPLTIKYEPTVRCPEVPSVTYKPKIPFLKGNPRI